ncbi:MAG: rRNA (cytidine-2'-O-)-methyltransferase, partial [Gammaproteobacteria bacterium]|nr:rRNA (cytidine-2'-O-)-methyltransferase [Gammaproteobacteria bacterium]
MSNHTENPAALFLVATPIGNLADISLRALETLKSVDLIAAEDTRHSKRLLQHYAIETRLVACHEHNEEKQTPGLVERLRKGPPTALSSDDGTPLGRDPVILLVRSAVKEHILVVPGPG